MIFHSFKNQEERIEFGDSAFMELQYCTLKNKSELREIVNGNQNWLDSSLYIFVRDIRCFCSNYAEIFYGGTYQNLQSGEIDVCGINYYSPEQLKDIILKIEEQKPLEYEVILEWLKKGEQFNGFYVIGIQTTI